MSGERYYRRVDSDSVDEQIKFQMSRNMRSFALEVGQNCRRVAGFFNSFWIFCSYYVCTTQCAIQAYLNSLTEYLEFCEADIVYHPTSYFGQFSKGTRKNDNIKPDKPTNTCICGEESKANIDETRRHIRAVTRWLKRVGINACLDDASKWNDGTIMWQILKKIGDRTEWPDQLTSGKKKENWSLIGAQIKRYYPGLVENQIILFCLIVSSEVSMHHVVYILHRTMNQHKRTLRAIVLRQALRSTAIMGNILRPRFTVSGSGIIQANVNLRNEFKVETPFPCPSFTVEVQDSNGEIWREATNNARIILHRGEEYSGMVDMRHSERPIDIVKVSRFLYKIFYIVRTKGEFKITIRPGIGKGGHIFGSPFTIQADGASIGRNSANPTRQQQLSSLKNKMTVEKGTKSDKLVRRSRTPGVSDDNTQEIDEAEKPQETLLKSSFFTRLLKKSVKSFTEIFLNPTKKSEKKKIKKERKRIIDPNSSWPAEQRVPSKVQPFFPASRRLKIRSVIIHRYKNEAMPSIEKYFFGKDFNVDENGNVAADAGKDRGMLRLMRQSLSTLVDDRGSDSRRKNHSLPNMIGSNRKPRLRRENNVFSAPWSRGKRHSDSKFWNGKPGRWNKDSSSSSESDVHETEFVKETKKEEIKRTRSADTHRKAIGRATDFRTALNSDNGVAEMLLRGAPSRTDDLLNSKEADHLIRTTVNAKGRNRRSGCSIVKRRPSHGQGYIPESFESFVNHQVITILNDAFQDVRNHVTVYT